MAPFNEVIGLGTKNNSVSKETLHWNISLESLFLNLLKT